jgi:hypothetical protein
VRFTVRGLMLVVAGVALFLGVIITSLRWLQYPHINVTIVNETSSPIYSVCLSSYSTERKVGQLRSGGVAMTVIQDGESNMWLTYRSLIGVVWTAGPFSEESGNRGYLEYHVTDAGVHVINGIYNFDAPPIFGIREVPRTGEMTVK